MAESLFWYDLETFGRDPQFDKIAQFAGVRTNDKFEVIEEPVTLYCKITPDYIPDPQACIITKITPQETLRKGICEYEFIKEINRLFSVPGTTVVGFNSIKFDDEFIRNALYRNFFDPYEREWKNGNSRWDIIDLVRMTHDLRPDGIAWPQKEDKTPVFRLEELTKANGLLHDHAHDALSDVYATIAVAKLIYEKQPKLFKYYLKTRNKNFVKNFFNFADKTPFVYTASTLSRHEGATSVMTPLIVDPQKKNQAICFDLRIDPTPFLNATVEEIRTNIYTKKSVLGEGRFPLHGISFNKCPAIAPIEVLKSEQAQNLSIDLDLCFKHNEMIKKDLTLTQKLWQVYTTEYEKSSTSQTDPDLQLYAGFFSDSDKEKFNIIHSIDPEGLLDIHIDFQDKKLQEMLWRFTCRNYYRLLDDETKTKWKSYCANRLMNPIKRTVDLHFYKRKIKEHLDSIETKPEDKIVYKELLNYALKVEKEIFSL